MYEIQMKDFVAHLMVEMKREQLYISHIRCAVDRVIRKGLVEKTEKFCDSLESVLRIVIDYPEMYRLTPDAVSLETIDYYKVKAENIANENLLPAEITDAIKEFAKDMKEPLAFALYDLSYSDSKKEAINSNYIDWLCARLEKCSKISSLGSCLCKTYKDIANFSLFQSLHGKLFRYYIDNLLNPYMYDGKDWYAFKHNYQGKEYNIIVMRERVKEQNIYHIESIVPRKDIVSFDNILTNIPEARLNERKKLLLEIRKLFGKAEYLDLSYSTIEFYLDEAYGKNER